MSIIKTAINVLPLISEVPTDVIEFVKNLESIATEISNSGAFGKVTCRDLVAKNLTEYATLKGYRTANMQNDLDAAKQTHALIFNATRGTLKKK